LGNLNSVHLRNIASFFSSEGHQVSVITFASGELDGIQTYAWPGRKLISGKAAYLLGIPWLKRRIAEIKPDLAHAVYLSSYGFLGALSGLHPLVISAIGSDILITPNRNRLFREIVKYTIQKSDLIHSQASHLTDRLTKLGADPSKIVTFCYGTDLNLVEEIEEAERIPREDFSIISTRHLEPIYDVETLVYGLQLVLKRIPSIQVRIVGEGSQKKSLQNLVTRLNLNSSVRFLGCQSQREVYKNLLRAQIYVSTALSDGSSLSLMEAMACGAFPVVTNIAANQELINHGENGFLFSPRSFREAAELIVEAFQKPNLCYQAMTINRQKIRQIGAIQRNLRGLQEIYHQLVEYYSQS
jgi:glycosyltransferase involved in cell wall biosynthesis